MGSYMFITYNEEIDLLGNATEFLNSLKHTFLPACAITSITAIILVFNSNVQSRQEKKKEIFTKKLDLYSEIIEKMNNYFKRKDKAKEDNLIYESDAEDRAAVLEWIAANNIQFVQKLKT